MKTVLDIWLERGYWISQMLLMLIALGAAVAAFLQLRTFKLIEFLKLIESTDFRRARRIVIREISKRKTEAWWEDLRDGERFESAASDVCALYDILAQMIEYDRMDKWISGGYGTFFRRYWRRSIVLNHDILRPFLDHRRKDHSEAYSAFTRLADQLSGNVPLSARQAPD